MSVIARGRQDYQIKLAILGDQHIDPVVGWINSPDAVNAACAQAAASDADLILWMGDMCTDGSSSGAWELIQTARAAIVASGKRDLMGVGNHDPMTYATTTLTRATTFKDVLFGKDKFPWMTGWMGDDSANFYYHTTIVGHELLFVFTEFGPRESVVVWADAVIKSFPTATCIFFSHAMLYTNGQFFRESTDTGVAYSWNPKQSHWSPPTIDIYDGWDLWQKSFSGNSLGLLQGNSNIKIALCGHSANPVSRRIDIRPDGSKLTTVLTNYQDVPLIGWWRTLSLDFVGDRILVTTQRATSPIGQWALDKQPAEDPLTSNFVIENAGLL